jgi:hypothetical protein
MELFTTRLDSPESRPFGLTGAEVLSIASTGEMAVSLSRRTHSGFSRIGTLSRLGMTGGGAPRDVRDDVIYADWSPDGKELAIVREAGGKAQLEFPIGKILHATAGWLSHPRVSPSGEEIALIEHPVLDDDGGYVLLVDRSGQSKKISATSRASSGSAGPARETRSGSRRRVSGSTASCTRPRVRGTSAFSRWRRAA